MDLHANTFISNDINSQEVGHKAAQALLDSFGDQPIRIVIAYSTVNHDQEALVTSLQEQLDPSTVVVGCSTQGVMAKGQVIEDGYTFGAIGLGGNGLNAIVASEQDIASDSLGKGRSLARQVIDRMDGKQPNVLLVLYDPLCGADVELLLKGVRESVECPVVGGASSQPWGPMVRTYQYVDGRVLGQTAIAIALSGPFSVDVGVCHGASPTGVTTIVTKAEGNRLLELDGRPALDVWREITGAAVQGNVDDTASWAVGIRRKIEPSDHVVATEDSIYVIRAAFGFDEDEKSVALQAAVPEGSELMFHHRTTSAVMDGTSALANELVRCLSGKKPWVALGFECGARTSPFLGREGTTRENTALQQAVAPEAEWLGMLAWGEVASCGGQPAFFNYTYPLLVMSKAS